MIVLALLEWFTLGDGSACLWSLVSEILPKINLLLMEKWTWLSHDITHWLNHPRLIAVPLFLVILLPLVIDAVIHASSWKPQLIGLRGSLPLRLGRFWKRWISRPAAILLTIYLVGTSPPAAALAIKGLVSPLPPDSGEPVDAIVVLSRGQEGLARYGQAVDLWKKGRASRIFVTGQGHVKTTARLLKSQNAPIDGLSGTRCALTTQDEARSTAAILGPQGVQTILLITDAAHMLRSLLTFQGLGFKVIPKISPLSSSVNSVRTSILALREGLGLISYAALGRFWPRSAENLRYPSAETIREMTVRNCPIDPKSSIG